MKFLPVYALVIGFTALNVQVAVASPNELIWTNQQLEAAKDCQISERNAIPFRIAILRQNALVKVNGPSELRPTQDLNVTLLSNSGTASPKAAQDVTIPRAGLADLSDQVLEIRPGGPTVTIGQTKLAGTFWQAAMNGQKFVVLECGKKSFFLFDVFTKDNADPIAHIGVSADETQILRTAIGHRADEAEKKITEDKQAEADRQNRNAAPAANPTASGKAAAKDSKPLTLAPMIPQEKPAAKFAVTTTSSIEYVVCVKDDGLQVRGQNLKTVLFTAKKLETVKPLQSFGAEKRTLVIGGVKHSFINVKFERSGQNTGWVAESYVKLKSECPYVPKAAPAAKPAEEKKQEPTPTGGRDFAKITGVNDSNCCDFPVRKRPTRSYLEGMRRFRAGRSGGHRLHAACDLYRVKQEDITAIAPGTVLRKYAFYQGTAVMEVRHPGGFIVLYGEIMFKDAPNTRAGSEIKAGQVVGYMGQVNSGCCEPMLHFELYSGTGHGPMLGWRNAYKRRPDLINPTAYLQRWEKAKFGQSY